MANIKIQKKLHNMRFNLAFWERVKAEADVTQANLETRLNDDFGNVASVIVLWGIYYGMPLATRPKSIEGLSFGLDELKDELDASVADPIEETIIEGMTKVQRQLVEKTREMQNKQIEGIGQKTSKKK